MSSTKITEKLCNEPYEPKNPKSPRCIVPRDAHEGRPHRAVRTDGSSIEWPLASAPR